MTRRMLSGSTSSSGLCISRTSPAHPHSSVAAAVVSPPAHIADDKHRVDDPQQLKQTQRGNVFTDNVDVSVAVAAAACQLDAATDYFETRLSSDDDLQYCALPDIASLLGEIDSNGSDSPSCSSSSAASSLMFDFSHHQHHHHQQLQHQQQSTPENVMSAEFPDDLFEFEGKYDIGQHLLHQQQQQQYSMVEDLADAAAVVAAAAAAAVEFGDVEELMSSPRSFDDERWEAMTVASPGGLPSSLSSSPPFQPYHHHQQQQHGDCRTVELLTTLDPLSSVNDWIDQSVNLDNRRVIGGESFGIFLRSDSSSSNNGSDGGCGTTPWHFVSVSDAVGPNHHLVQLTSPTTYSTSRFQRCVQTDANNNIGNCCPTLMADSLPVMPVTYMEICTSNNNNNCRWQGDVSSRLGKFPAAVPFANSTGDRQLTSTAGGVVTLSQTAVPSRLSSSNGSGGGRVSKGSTTKPARSGRSSRKGGKSRRSMCLWQFLRELLHVPQLYQSSIRWIDRNGGIFKIEDSGRVAKLWGECKNRPAMNYDKLSRSIRQYYKQGIIRKTNKSRRLVFQFCPQYL